MDLLSREIISNAISIKGYVGHTASSSLPLNPSVESTSSLILLCLLPGYSIVREPLVWAILNEDASAIKGYLTVAQRFIECTSSLRVLPLFLYSVPIGHGEVGFGSVLQHPCDSIASDYSPHPVQVEYLCPEISLCSFIACLPCPHPLLTLCLGICLRRLSTSYLQSVFSNVRVGVACKLVRGVQSLN